MHILVLASGSQRRTELLKEVGIPHRVARSNVEEKSIPGEAADEMVCRLAQAKAFHVAEKLPREIVLGADTVVLLKGQILGKPADMNEARAMLGLLSGETHRVYTGVCLTRRHPQRTVTWSAVTQVTFHELRPDQIEYCLNSSNPLDKAGAYAIQQHEEILIAGYHGLRSNVVGLPVEEVVTGLRDHFNFHLVKEKG